MKNFYSILFIAFVLPFKAQLTLTHAFNSPIVGDSWNAADYDSTLALSRATGTNKVWDYSSIVTGTGGISNTTYTTPSSVPGITAAFPSANLIGYSAPSTSATSYDVYNISAANDALIGGYQPSSTPPTTSLSNSYYEFGYPFAYGNTNTFSVTSTSGTGTNQAQGVVHATITATGAGTVLLPGGVKLSNCLQLKTKALVTFSVSGFTFTVNSVDYSYYSNTQKFCVISISNNTTTSSFGPPTIDYGISVNTAVVSGIEEKSLNTNVLNIYPSPVKDVITLKIEKELHNAFYQVVDVSGKVLKESSFGGTEAISINVSELDPGIYFVKVKGDNFATNKRIIISR